MTTKQIMFTTFALIASTTACHHETASDAPVPSPIELGKHLVTIGGCNDCHTPLKMGPNGPAPDFDRTLSGHPAGMPLPPPPALPAGPWMTTVAATNTAWSGPWGVSFTANLTPDKDTGLGTWTKQTFIDTLRNAKHMGAGRPLLPPMPAAGIAQMSDDELGAVFAYLQSLPPISNRVPDPIAPPVASTAPAGSH